MSNPYITDKYKTQKLQNFQVQTPGLVKKSTKSLYKKSHRSLPAKADAKFCRGRPYVDIWNWWNPCLFSLSLSKQYSLVWGAKMALIQPCPRTRYSVQLRYITTAIPALFISHNRESAGPNNPCQHQITTSIGASSLVDEESQQCKNWGTDDLRPLPILFTFCNCNHASRLTRVCQDSIIYYLQVTETSLFSICGFAAIPLTRSNIHEAECYIIMLSQRHKERYNVF